MMSTLSPLRPGDPTELAGYRVVGRLGQGGQGTVYRGEGPDGVPVAIKLLNMRKIGDVRARARFAREVSAARQVGEFCTARVLAADAEGDLPYLVSEFIDGVSLQEAVTRDGPMAGLDLERLGIGMATALAAIHRAGIVHRDFKPANVLLSGQGPRVVDFGIARAMDATSTLTSQAIGTPAYMAPEQLRGETVGPAADVFAWACTLVYAATGTPPFGDDSVAAVVKRISRDAPSLGSLTGTQAKTASWCLAKDPAQRPTADKLLTVLLGRTAPEAPEITLAAGSHAAAALTTRTSSHPLTPPPATPPTAAPSTGEETTGQGTTRRRILVGTGVLAAAAAAGGVTWATGARKEPRTLWRHDTNAKQLNKVVLAGDTLFASESIVYGGRLFALDAVSGRQRWVWHWETPWLAAAGSVLYVYDGENLYAVDAATGRKRWMVPADFDEIAVADGMVIGFHKDENVLDMKAVSTADGRKLWTHTITFPSSDLVPDTHSTAAASGAVLMANKTTVYAVSTANGTILWRFPAKGDLEANLLALGNTVYVADQVTGPGKLWALEATTGQIRWTWSGGVPATASSSAVYVSAGGLFALDARTGGKLWQYEPGSDAVGPVRGIVATTTSDPVSHKGAIEALDARTGKLRWRQALPKGYENPLFCGYSNDAIFVRFGNGEIRALRAR
jgi:outer membrane protein assembly factor BamB